MPIPQPRTVRIDPLDLQKNISIGVDLPFNSPGVFRVTYTTKDQTKANLINLLLTQTGERVMNPEFGTELRKFLFEGITDKNSDRLIATGFNPKKNVEDAVRELIEKFRAGELKDEDHFYNLKWMQKTVIEK